MIKINRINKIVVVFLSVFIIMFLIVAPKTFAYGWGVSKNRYHETPDVGFYKKELQGTDSYYVGDTNKKEIYLTFDAGYDNGVLEKILDILKEKNVKSTFFVTGDFLTRQEKIAKRIYLEGHIIGNHTWNHKNITKINKDKLKEEIEKVENKYYNITGEKMIKFLRPPEGEFSKESLLNVKSLGYKTFFWSIAYKDWETNKQHGGDYGYKAIMNNIHNGAIVLLHTVSQDNLECLPRVIDDLRSEGYTIKNLNEMSF